MTFAVLKLSFYDKSCHELAISGNLFSKKTKCEIFFSEKKLQLTTNLQFCDEK